MGRGVLRAYFATMPSLPLLVWVNLHAGGQVFKFPSEQSVTEMNILSWLERLKAGLEIPSSKWTHVCNVPKHTLLALFCLGEDATCNKLSALEFSDGKTSYASLSWRSTTSPARRQYPHSRGCFGSV